MAMRWSGLLMIAILSSLKKQDEKKPTNIQLFLLIASCVSLDWLFNKSPFKRSFFNNEKSPLSERASVNPHII